MIRHQEEYLTVVTDHSVCTDDISCGVYTATDVIEFNFEDGYASLVEKVVTPDGDVKYRTTAVKGVTVNREVKEGRGQMIEVTVFLCQACITKSGYGTPIEIVYSNTGGWSPEWEGRHCVHLTAQEILRSNK